MRAFLPSALLLALVTAAAAASTPDGTWPQTCRDGSVSGDSFTAFCRQRDGNWNFSRIDIRDCRTVENYDGRLSCADEMGGSFQSSCRDVRVSGRKIEAVCADRNGAWWNASIESNRCMRGEEIANDDGRLVCRRR